MKQLLSIALPILALLSALAAALWLATSAESGEQSAGDAYVLLFAGASIAVLLLPTARMMPPVRGTLRPEAMNRLFL